MRRPLSDNLLSRPSFEAKLRAKLLSNVQLMSTLAWPTVGVEMNWVGNVATEGCHFDQVQYN